MTHVESFSSNEARSIVLSIVTTTPRPQQQQRPQSSQSKPGRTTRTSKSAEPSTNYPSEWVVDRAEFRKAFRAFLEATAPYRKTQYYRSFLVGAVSASSVSSASSDPLSQSSSSAAPDAPKAPKQHILPADNDNDTEHRSASLTSAKSAEEAIYSRSIGLEPEPEPEPIGSESAMRDRVDSTTQTAITVVMEQMSTRFNQQMQEMQRTLLQSLQQGQASQGPSGPSGPQGPAGSSTTVSGHILWKPEELGFFDPHLSASYEVGSMIRDDRDMMYRSVHLFAERILRLSITKDQELLRTNLNTCLRDTAMS